MRVNLYLALGFQGCYLNPEGTFFVGEEESSRIKEKVRSLIEHPKDGDILYIHQMIRRADDSYFQHEPTSCIVGHADILNPHGVSLLGVNRIVSPRPNLAAHTAFRTALRRHDIQKIFILGAEAHQSVFLTAATLKELDYDVVVLADYVGSRDPYLRTTALSMLSGTAGVEVL